MAEESSSSRRAALTQSGGWSGTNYTKSDLFEDSDESQSKGYAPTREPTRRRQPRKQSVVAAAHKSTSDSTNPPPREVDTYITDIPILEGGNYRVRSTTSLPTLEARTYQGTEPRKLPSTPTRRYIDREQLSTDSPYLERLKYPESSALPNASLTPRTPTTPQQLQFSETGTPQRPASVNREMNYQNYLDSPGAGPSNGRQPPQPPQSMNHQNGGMNGMGIGGMVGYPTPAGHQSDLNYVMSMVDELSQVLRQNQALTGNIVDKMGKVRERASTMNLSNDELIQVVSNELNLDTRNLEKELSELRARFEKAEYDKNENWKLVLHGANILADIKEKVHAFKEQTESDCLAWHKSYRNQLAMEREENMNLRNQIFDMHAAAGRANGHLRDMRKYLTEHDELHELRVQVHQYRTERRWWKRMALPLIPDDDSMWSDDDDLIDPEEKKRLAAIAREKEEKAEDEGGQA